MDAENINRTVVEPLSLIRTDALSADVDWFVRVLETRINLYFGKETPYRDISEIAPPEICGHSPYARFLREHQLTFAERLTFLLALLPHIKPQLLDLFFVKNATTGRLFAEFGGRENSNCRGFLPTGETAFFLLAGENLDKRVAAAGIFDPERVLVRRGILSLEEAAAHEPSCSGYLTLSPETLDLVTLGRARRPAFSRDFPARRLEMALDWEDLVLDTHTMEQVLEIKTWAEYGHILFEDTGLKKRLKPGYRALFFGPSGTGKTLTATLLGKMAGRDVYCIDLSMVVSKYIGETEKNLEKIFQKAEQHDWILFFDEADALFGKRTDIRDAHDRYANQEVSYLLQRVDDYDGIVILASNLRSNLDEAFTRRFQSIIHFPMPKPAERLKMWDAAFSEKLRPEPTVDLAAIADRFELSGGAIMNVVRYASLMTLKQGKPAIAEGVIVDGIRKELHKEGRTS